MVEFFEAAAEKVNPKLAINWTTVELQRAINYVKKELHELDIKIEHFIELLELIEKRSITELKAKEILNSFIPKSFSPKEHAKTHSTISNEDEIEKIAKKIIKDNQKAVQDYKSGQANALNFLIGQLMKETNKRADYRKAKEIFERLLK